MLHNNLPLFNYETYELNITLKDLLIKIRSFIIEDTSRNIQFLKINKNNPKTLLDEDNPYFDLSITLYDYMKFYEIQKNNNIDFIFKIYNDKIKNKGVKIDGN